MGLDWRPGDRMVGFREEFPANLYPWKRLEAKGVEVTWLSVYDSLERIEEACRGARLLAISFVQFLGGYRAPIQEIGEICRRNRCIYFVDAIQGLGAFPLDVRACHIDALAADGHKWMLGPEGCGILYISQELQDRVEPVEFGWTNVAGYTDYASRDMALRPDAGRYECGTLNTIGCFGLKASIEFLLEVGQGEMAPVIQNLGDRIAAGVQAKGYELLVERTPQNGAGIVTFRKPGVDAAETCASSAAEDHRRAARGVGPHLSALLHQSGGDRPTDRRPAVTNWLRRHPLAAFLPLQALIYCWNLGLLSAWCDEAITLLAMRGTVTRALAICRAGYSSAALLFARILLVKNTVGYRLGGSGAAAFGFFCAFGNGGAGSPLGLALRGANTDYSAGAVDAFALSPALCAHVPLVFPAGAVCHRGVGAGGPRRREGGTRGTPRCWRWRCSAPSIPTTRPESH